MKPLTNQPSFIHRLGYRAARIATICIMLWLFVPVEAQVYSTAQYNTAQSLQYDRPHGAYNASYGANASYGTDATQTNYQPYRSTIYEPFGSQVPTGPKRSNGAIGEEDDDDDNSDDDWTGDFGHVSDPNQSQNSPVGDAWVLLLFAAVAAGVVYKKQRTLTTKTL